MNKIKKLIFLIPFMLAFSSVYSQVKPFSYISPRGDEVTPQYETIFEISNQTNIGATIAIRQCFQNEDLPYSEWIFESFYFEPRETKSFSVPIKIDPVNPLKVWFSGSVTAPISTYNSEEYGTSSFNFERDFDKVTGKAVNGYLYEYMIYPGDELWPPLDPFPAVKLNITN